MAQTPTFELVSFELCPYVQRSVITLKHKKIDFKLTFIDLEQPPEWFEKISPLGKVPLLLVRNAGSAEPVVLFESAVINEYLDEITPPELLPKNPLEKARERAWVAVSSEILMSMYPLMTSQDPGEIAEAKTEIWDILSRVEDVLPGGNFFNGKSLSLVDTAFAPAFMRLLMIRSLREDAHWSKLSKTRRWADALLALPEVRESVPADLKPKYAAFLKKRGSSLAAEIS
jgi:glutathione S-transferase